MRGNGSEKRKGFTMIELIIVLAIMVIITAIAIPNFAVVWENSKAKADTQSCEAIKRTILMLVADGTIVKPTSTEKLKAFTVVDGTKGSAASNYAWNNFTSNEQSKIVEALKDTNKPQGKTSSIITITATTGISADTSDADAAKFAVTLDTSDNIVVKSVK